MASCYKAVFVYNITKIITADLQFEDAALFQHIFFKIYMFPLDLINLNRKVQVCFGHHSLDHGTIF